MYYKAEYFRNGSPISIGESVSKVGCGSKQVHVVIVKR